MKLLPFIRENIPLAGMTTFGIGGPARWFAKPSTRQELVQTLRLAADLNVPVLPLGGGSNLLVADTGVEAMIVKFSSRGEFAKMLFQPGEPLSWRVGAAVPLSSFVASLAKEGVAGLEMMAGIPGSVGGAVCMNAGSASGGIGRFVVKAEAYDRFGNDNAIEAPDLRFSYRHSTLRGMLATAFTFRFDGLADPDELRSSVQAFRDKKKASQPMGVPSAGCVFKNPPNVSAGALLDAAGCKGMSEGGAVVSAMHANYIVNNGGARSADVAVLAYRMREAVKRAHGIALELEIVLWGDDPHFNKLTESGTANENL